MAAFDEGDRSAAHLQPGKMRVALNSLRPCPHNRVLCLGVDHDEEEGDGGKDDLCRAMDGLTKMPEVLWKAA